MTPKTKPTGVYTLASAPTHPLAARLGLTERQFRRAVQSGRLEHYRPGGLRVLLTDEQITAWIEGSAAGGDRG